MKTILLFERRDFSFLGHSGGLQTNMLLVHKEIVQNGECFEMLTAIQHCCDIQPRDPS